MMAELDSILKKLDDRRVYGDDIAHQRLDRDDPEWFYIPLDTSDVDVLRKVYELTTGRLMIGMASVTVEDEKDAVNLKLAF
jgi:hypothetical protein